MSIRLLSKQCDYRGGSMICPESSIAGDQDDHRQAVLKLSGSSSDFLGEKDTDSDGSKLSSRSRSSGVRRDERKTSPHEEPTLRRKKKGNNSDKHYSDHYLELFKNTIAEFESGSNGVPPIDLLPTQLGAVLWQPSEKERLFNALSRNGRLDEARIATVVEKSELEVREYLTFLCEREAERHLFEKQTKRISHADIPAAVEISEECETALEQAADALAMFQDQYDCAVAEQKHPSKWSIDWDTARALDEQVLDREEAGSECEELPNSEGIPAEGLFRLSSWLELSERIFMNPGPPRLQNNWHNLATDNERPALTYAAFSDFYDLAVSVTRRLTQTCMFLAESRMRSNKGQGYSPKPSVKQQDVVAALEVLGMTSSLSDNLLGLARRNSLRVVHGSHDKGKGRSQVLTYDEVEKDISSRKRSQRGRRSVSAGSRSSGTSTSMEDAASDPENHATTISARNQTSPHVSPSLVSIQDPDADVSVSDVSMSDLDIDAEDSQVDEYGELPFHASTSRQKRRHIHLESQQDAYLEDLDRLRTEEEEKRLWQILGREPPRTIKREVDKDLGIRPKILRKTKEDLADWQGVFASEWEAFGERIPEERFLGIGMAKSRQPEGESRRGSHGGPSSEGYLSVPVRTVEAGDDDESAGETD